MIDLNDDRCHEVLNRGTTAHVGVVDDGEPYVTPMSYVMLDGVFYFRTAPGRRDTVLRAAPRMCVEVSESDGDAWQSVVFWGDAEFVEDTNERADVVAALLHKYHSESALGFSTPTPVPEERSVVKVVPEQLTGRGSGGGLGRKTRPGRL